MSSNDLSKFELIILKGISLGFDHKKLAKELSVDEEEVIEAIKALIKKGYVKYHSKLIGGKLKLTKKGYEILVQYDSGISLRGEETTKDVAARVSPATVQKTGSKLKKVVIVGVILFFVFAIILPRLPILFTVNKW